VAAGRHSVLAVAVAAVVVELRVVVEAEAPRAVLWTIVI